MCFYIHPKHIKEKIAKRDIVCYKRLERKTKSLFISPFQRKSYKLNRLYKNRLEVFICRGFITSMINVGIHSYSNKKYAIFRRWSDEILVKGIIPKGSKYYYNPNDKEYVSNQIILQEIIK